jgi:hypothetical protein
MINLCVSTSQASGDTTGEQVIPTKIVCRAFQDRQRTKRKTAVMKPEVKYTIQYHYISLYISPQNELVPI